MSRRSQARAEARRAAQSARRQRRRPDRMLVSAIMLLKCSTLPVMTKLTPANF